MPRHHLDVELALQRHGGNLDELARALGLSPGEILDFSTNVNPWGPPPVLRERMTEWLAELARYPDPESVELGDLLARRHHTRPERLLVGHGMNELIHLIVRAIQPQRVLILGPTFAEYQRAVEAAGGEADYWLASQEEGFQWRLNRLEFEQRLARAELVFVCAPNNPTGVTLAPGAWQQLFDLCHRSQVPLVIDEAFVWTLDEALPMAEGWPWIIRLRSLTKLFGVPGLRLGYLMADPVMVATMARLQPTWPVSRLAQAIGRLMLEDEAFLRESLAKLRDARQALWFTLRELTWLRVYPSEANFFLCEILLPQLNSGELYAQLAERGILIRNGDSFNGLAQGRFIRIAVRPVEDQSRLIAALQEIAAHAG